MLTLLDLAPIVPILAVGILLLFLFVVVPGIVFLAVFLIRRAVKKKNKGE